MRIAIISDTHAYEPTPWMEAVYQAYLEPADVLIHCGDITGMAMWTYFLQHPQFHAVSGNMCDWNLSAELDDRLSVMVGPLTVGVVHGIGYGHGRADIPDGVAQAFGSSHDLVCFGHTHHPHWGEHHGVRVVNPGSLRESGGNPTLAYVDVFEGKRMEHQLVAVPRMIGAVKA